VAGAVAAAAVGPRLAWSLPLGYACAVYLSAGIRNDGGRVVWAFVMQPAASTAALVSAVVALPAGTAVWSATARKPMR